MTGRPGRRFVLPNWSFSDSEIADAHRFTLAFSIVYFQKPDTCSILSGFGTTFKDLICKGRSCWQLLTLLVSSTKLPNLDIALGIRGGSREVDMCKQIRVTLNVLNEKARGNCQGQAALWVLFCQL